MGSIDIRRDYTEIKILHLCHAWCDRHSVERIRKTFVRHQLPEIKHRKDTVKLSLRISPAGKIATEHTFITRRSHHGKISDDGTI